MKFVALPSASAKGVCWIVRVPQAGTGSKVPRFATPIVTSILKKFLDVTNLVIGNKVASFTNLYQCLLELSMYFIHGTQGYKYPIFVHRSTEQNNKYFTITITGLGNLTHSYEVANSALTPPACSRMQGEHARAIHPNHHREGPIPAQPGHTPNNSSQERMSQRRRWNHAPPQRRSSSASSPHPR